MPISRLRAQYERAERAFRKGWGRDLSTPMGRQVAHLHFQLADQQILRGLWTNLEEFAPGAWRANQPSPARLARYKARGIRTILNLRAPMRQSYHLLETEACATLGLKHVTCALAAGDLVAPERLLDLLGLFETMERPFLMHCKSGADRTGLAAALYLIHIEGVPVATAAQQLHWRYIHFRSKRTGVLDHLIETYAAAHAATGIAVRDWIATDYDPVALEEAWDRAHGLTRKRRKRR